jgi:curved DNA-binding protein CbpA
MTKRDLYRVLGVSAGAAPADIKRAYRRIAFAVHPDVGDHADSDRFRKIREAYETLSNPDRRRSYDIEIAIRRQPLSAEPLRSKRPVGVRDDFLTMRPSIEELLDHIGQNFFGYRSKSGAPLLSNTRRSLTRYLPVPAVYTPPAPPATHWDLVWKRLCSFPATEP